jgi:hypothetical protein
MEDANHMRHFRKSGFMIIIMAVIAVVAGITLLFSKEAPVKKISAKLECSYESGDGTIYRYPGNGVTAKPRIDGTINCWISLKKIPAGAALKGRLKAKGKVQEAEVIPRPDDTYSADASFSPENGDFDSCTAFTVTGELVQAGKIAWKGAIKIAQICHD